jgi:hypothetical protein
MSTVQSVTIKDTDLFYNKKTPPLLGGVKKLCNYLKMTLHLPVSGITSLT